MSRYKTFLELNRSLFNECTELMVEIENEIEENEDRNKKTDKLESECCCFDNLIFELEESYKKFKRKNIDLIKKEFKRKK